MTSEPTRISRRGALRLVTLAAAGTLLAACGPQVGQAPPAAGGTPAGRIVASANVKGIEHRQMDRFMLTNTYLA